MIFSLRNSHNRVTWLEFLLALALVMLALQLVPSLGQIALLVLDIRKWPRTVWFVANVAIVTILLGIRFGPVLIGDWKERRQRLSLEKVKADKVCELKKQRESIENIKRSRSRRMY